jgi:hypothetical protein
MKRVKRVYWNQKKWQKWHLGSLHALASSQNNLHRACPMNYMKRFKLLQRRSPGPHSIRLNQGGGAVQRCGGLGGRMKQFMGLGLLSPNKRVQTRPGCSSATPGRTSRCSAPCSAPDLQMVPGFGTERHRSHVARFTWLNAAPTASRTGATIVGDGKPWRCSSPPRSVVSTSGCD